VDAFKGSYAYGGQPFLLQVGDFMRKIFYVAVSLGLTVVLLAISVVLIVRTNDLNELKLKHENSMKATMQEVFNDMRTVENDLSKLMITVNEKSRTGLLSKIAMKSAACGQELSRLPIIATGVQNTLKFTNQLSSYCVITLNNEKMPDNFDEQIVSFYDTCKNVNVELSKLESDIHTKKISLLEINENTVTDGIFGSIDNELLEYPSVIFDGPFSDGQERSTPKNKREAISKEAAAEYVKKLGFSAEYKNEVSGILPVYVFEKDNMTLQITKEGGLLLMAISDRTIENAVLNEEEAEKRAMDFVKKLDYGQVKNVWQEYYSNYTVFNFAPVVDDIVIYPDIFKVKVALDNGDIMAFEGKSYIMNNHPRQIEETKISEEEAKKQLKDGFNIESSRLCLISVNEKEHLCYEFFGSFNELDYAIYISAIDGEEKTSFRILNADTGKMVQ